MPYKKTKACGGPNGDNIFSDANDLIKACRLTQVIVKYGTVIDSIRSVWIGTEGEEIKGELHGFTGGDKTSTVTLAPGEFIVGITGSTEGKNTSTGELTGVITGLQFVLSNGTTVESGVIKNDSKFQLVDLKVGGFFGKSGTRLDSLGCYTLVECK